jgi:hypothetical protein
MMEQCRTIGCVLLAVIAITASNIYDCVHGHYQNTMKFGPLPVTYCATRGPSCHSPVQFNELCTLSKPNNLGFSVVNLFRFRFQFKLPLLRGYFSN